MAKLNIDDIKINTISSHDIVTAHGQIIASRGAILTEALIAKLRFYGIKELDVVDSAQELDSYGAEPVLIPEPTAPLANDASTYTQRIRQSPEFAEFQMSYNKNLALLEATYENIKNERYNQVDTSHLLAELNSLFNKKTTLDLFNTIHTLDGNGSIYSSNLNVALISRGIGRWLHFTKEGLDTVTLAGLFHDIGKISVPPEILNKTGTLTGAEFNTMKKHTLFGQRLLKNVPGINQSVIDAAIQHHEKFDGSGYPMGLEGDEIDEYAAVVAIADVYEAMTALRPHRKPLSAFQVIESFEGDGLQKYNPQYILTFLSRLANAYQNRSVVLSDGRNARIIYINQGKLSHPIVEFEDGETIDLSKEANLHISEVI